MPFAGYKNFKDCVSKNSDKKDPQAYCAEIQRRSEGKRSKKASSPRTQRRRRGR
jgi:hypothetical protein